MNPDSVPPQAWAPAHSAARLLVSPIRRFLAIEAASGLLLLAATVIALVWANSAWSDSYHHLWHTELGATLGDWRFARPLHFWVNDGLMAIFFFVVGLEIRRELADGELSDWKRASLPLAAALGGMLIPAAIYAALNHGRAGSAGWGVPMATDIAFAVGVLTLLGKRAPPALRVLLLALAVIDDIGAILVIAVFYSDGIALTGLGAVGVGASGIVVLQLIGVRAIAAFVAPALVIWGGLYVAGIHPTLAGVIVGLMTPVRAWYGTERFVAETESNLRGVRDDRQVMSNLDAIARAGQEAVSPVEYLIHNLHGVVAFAIMPLFALANAGVTLGGASLEGDGLYVFAGIVLGLALGKPLGIGVFSWTAIRAGLAVQPRHVTGACLGVVGVVGGIGFTMSLFIAALAFPPGPLLETAKLAVLVGSAAAIIIGLSMGALMLRPPAEPVASEDEAERSSDV
jgi:NhaA family Na+:H+ antiporter